VSDSLVYQDDPGTTRRDLNFTGRENMYVPLQSKGSLESSMLIAIPAHLPSQPAPSQVPLSAFNQKIKSLENLSRKSVTHEATGTSSRPKTTARKGS